MTINRFDRRGTSIHPDPKIGRMFLCSLGLHLAVVLLFAGVLFPRFHRKPAPAYTVDLVNLPVKNPQAGRPEARRAPHPVKKHETRAPAPKPKPVRRQEAVTLPEKKAHRPKPAKRAVARKPRVKPAPKPAVKPRNNYNEALSAIDRMRRRQEIADLEKKLNSLATTASPVPDAPPGMPQGKGDEVGPSQKAWLHQFLKQNWSLSKYQVTRRDLEAKAILTFDARGNLIDYHFTKKSGDSLFDDSVLFAILQAQKLPFKPGRRWQVPVIFNLKDLMDQ